MQTLRSLVPLALAVTLATPAVRGQGQQDSSSGAPAPATTFVKEFGPRDQVGSFRVKFDARGAGVVFLQLLDHYVDVAANRKREHDVAKDYLLLLWAGSDHSFYVAQTGAGGLFDKNLSTDVWQHEKQDDSVRFWIDSADGMRLSKTFRHRPEQRGLAVELQLENLGGVAAAGAFQFEFGGPALLNPSETSLLGNPAFAIAVPEGGETVAKHPEGRARQELLNLGGGRLSMAGSTNRFFGGFVFPLDDAAATSTMRADYVPLPGFDDTTLGTQAFGSPRVVLSAALPVPPANGKSSLSYGVYLGPKSFRVFDESPEHARFLPIMDFDLEPPCCGVSVPGGRFMAATLLKLLGWFESIVGNWGVAIMMLTILVRGAMSPLNFRMQKSMRAFGAKMAKLKPKLDEIKERYKGDPKAHQQAMIEFQREHKMIPPIGGCLPIFLTMPIYIGLFTALRTAYDLRQQGFMLWIDDLSRPDALFHLGWPVVPNLNLLPLIWIALIIILQLRMPLPTDPQQRQMQQIMRYMPVIFGVLLYNYASGLMVYMVTSMLWSLVETSVTKKILGPVDPNAGGMVPTPMM